MKTNQERTINVIEQELRDYHSLNRVQKEEVVAWWTEHADEVERPVELEQDNTVEILGCKVTFMPVNEDQLTTEDRPARRRNLLPKDDRFEDYKFRMTTTEANLLDELDEIEDNSLLRKAANQNQAEIKYGRTTEAPRNSHYEEGCLPGYVRYIDERGNFINFFTPEQVTEYDKQEVRWASINKDLSMYHRDEENTKKMVVNYIRDRYVEKIKACDNYSRIKEIIGDYKKGIQGTCWKVIMRVLGGKDFNHSFIYPFSRDATAQEVTSQYIERLTREKEITKEIAEIKKVIRNGGHSKLSLNKLSLELSKLYDEKKELNLPKTLGQLYFTGFSKPLWDAVEESVWKKNRLVAQEEAAKAYRMVKDLIGLVTDIDQQIEIILDRRSGIDKKIANEATFYASTLPRAEQFSYKTWKALKRVGA